MQNLNDWKDKFGKRLEIGQKVVACKGKNLYIGYIEYFTKSGITLESQNPDDSTARVSIPYDMKYSYNLGPNKVIIIG